MSLFRICLIGILLAIVVCGCSSHYYTVNDNGMMLFLRQPDAKNVLLYSSLDGFVPHVNKKEDGMWVVTLPADREFCYFYEVDGKIFTPWCRLMEKDDLGTENCVYVPRL